MTYQEDTEDEFYERSDEISKDSLECLVRFWCFMEQQRKKQRTINFTIFQSVSGLLVNIIP